MYLVEDILGRLDVVRMDGFHDHEWWQRQGYKIHEEIPEHLDREGFEAWVQDWKQEHDFEEPEDPIENVKYTG